MPFSSHSAMAQPTTALACLLRERGVPFNLHEELLDGLGDDAWVFVGALQRVALAGLEAARGEDHGAPACEELLDARLYVLEETPLLVLGRVWGRTPRVEDCREVVLLAVRPVQQRAAVQREQAVDGLLVRFGEPEDDAGGRGFRLAVRGISFGGGVLLSGHAQVHQA